MDSLFLRRRLAALAAIAVVGLVAGLIVSNGRGDSESKPETTAAAKAKAAAAAKRRHRPRSLLVQSHRGWRRHPGPVPVLMYHVIEKAKPGVPLPELYVSGKVFKAQMAALAKRGYQGVTLDQVENGWRGAALPRKPIVVSFDDGYRSQYTVARPTLLKLGWPGVLALCVANLKVRNGISFNRVTGMLRSGWELASHTITHPDLRAVDDKKLRHELRDSRRILRFVYHQPVHNFVYPAGDYNERVAAAVKKQGYEAALTVAPGLASSDKPFELNRIRVTEDMGVGGLLEKVTELGG